MVTMPARCSVAIPGTGETGAWTRLPLPSIGGWLFTPMLAAADGVLAAARARTAVTTRVKDAIDWAAAVTGPSAADQAAY
jgi:hypothetical protein